MQFQPPRAPMVTLRSGPRCVPPPPNMKNQMPEPPRTFSPPVIPSARLGTRNVPGFSPPPSRGVTSPNGMPPRAPIARFSPPGIKREMSLPTSSVSSPESQLRHHHKERPKSMTITKNISMINSPKSPQSDEINSHSITSSTISSDSEEIQFTKETFDRLCKENKEMNKRCNDLMKSNKSLQEQVEIFSLRSDNLTKKVEDLEKRNKELEMKIEQMDTSTDIINNKLKEITTEYSDKKQTETYLKEKNKNLLKQLYKYKDNKKEIHFSPSEYKSFKSLTDDNTSPLCIYFGDEKIYISFYKDDKIVKVNDINNKPISNCVYYSPDSKDILVGSLAQAKLSTNPLNSINYISLLAGETTSTTTSDDKDFIINRIKYKVNENDNSKYVVELQYNNENVQLTTLQILTELFKYIMQQSSYSLEIHPIRKCIISLPVYFSELQKFEFLQASKDAGFVSIQIFQNPISSLYSYLSSFKPSSSQTVLVFDLQPTRLELSVVTIINSVITIITSKKYFEINDKLLIAILVDYFKNEYVAKAESELSEEQLLNLIKECEMAYNVLKTESSTEIDIDEFRDNKVDVKLKRSKLYSLYDSFFNDCTNKTIEVLNEMNLNREDITCVIAIGEKTQLPKFNEIFKKSFKNAKVYCSNKSTEEDISSGLSHYISEKYYESKDYFLPYTPNHEINLNINGNVSQLYNRFRPIKYPIENSVRVFTTENNQSSIPISLYEDRVCIINEVIDDLTLLEAGDICVNVKYSIDTNGEISILAKEEITDKHDEKVENEELEHEISQEQIFN